MTDRELLEAAARAAGIRVTGQWSDTKRMYANTKAGWWNPLIDDGDALRLAVKLRIEVSARAQTVAAYPWNPTYGIEHRGYAVEHFKDSDPYAATRRAIVRAAASLAGDAASSTDAPGVGDKPIPTASR